MRVTIEIILGSAASQGSLSHFQVVLVFCQIILMCVHKKNDLLSWLVLLNSTALMKEIVCRIKLRYFNQLKFSALIHLRIPLTSSMHKFKWVVTTLCPEFCQMGFDRGWANRLDLGRTQFKHSFIQSFNKYVLRTYHGSFIVLTERDTAENRQAWPQL